MLSFTNLVINVSIHMIRCTILFTINTNYILVQGFNTGVVLYRFDRMRNNKIYNSYLNSAKVKELVDE